MNGKSEELNQRARTGIGSRDLAVLGLLLLPLLVFVLPPLTGRTYFWGDLMYLHHPWRALPAEMLARGSLPLWNPYTYLGMPLAAQMQGAVWYPGSLPFYLFGFATALPIYHVLHYWMGGALCFLWLRSLGLSRFAAAAGAFAGMLSGGFVRDLPFLNHIGTLCYLPAFLLLWRRPALLAVALALSFLAGYPQMLAGAAAAAWLITAALRWSRSASPAHNLRLLGGLSARWAAAGVMSLGLGAVLLLPALRLTAESRRSGGLESQESLTFSFAPQDLVQFTGPPLIRKGEFSPAYKWWKTSYWGVFGLGAALLGLARLPGIAVAGSGVYLTGVALLVLGGSNPLSAWLWEHLVLLKYIRYPGNLSYLAGPLLVLLIAWGLHRRRLAALAALAIAAELFTYALMGLHPTAPRTFFTDRGPLVPALRQELGGHRYLLSPLALNWHRGQGPDLESASLDLKHRLYGVTNMPYHLASVGNFGEPLVPSRSYDFMDFLYRRAGLADVRPWLGWADIRVLMTRDRLPSGGLRYLGDTLWHVYRNPGPAARAFWFEEDAGEKIPPNVGEEPPDLDSGVPLRVERPREHLLRVSGESDRPGWVYLAEPLGPGWKGLLTAGGRAEAPSLEPALTAFWKLRVPQGSWTLRFRYAPWTWPLGVLLTCLSIIGLAAGAFGYTRSWEKGAQA